MNICITIENQNTKQIEQIEQTQKQNAQCDIPTVDANHIHYNTLYKHIQMTKLKILKMSEKMLSQKHVRCSKCVHGATKKMLKIKLNNIKLNHGVTVRFEYKNQIAKFDELHIFAPTSTCILILFANNNFTHIIQICYKKFKMK